MAAVLFAYMGLHTYMGVQGYMGTWLHVYVAAVLHDSYGHLVSIATSSFSDGSWYSTLRIAQYIPNRRCRLVLSHSA